MGLYIYIGPLTWALQGFAFPTLQAPHSNYHLAFPHAFFLWLVLFVASTDDLSHSVELGQNRHGNWRPQWAALTCHRWITELHVSRSDYQFSSLRFLSQGAATCSDHQWACFLLHRLCTRHVSFFVARTCKTTFPSASMSVDILQPTSWQVFSMLRHTQVMALTSQTLLESGGW